MKQENYICNQCKKENLFSFIEIEKGIIRRGSGKTINKTMGFYEDKLKDLAFCSYECLEGYFLKFPLHKGTYQRKDMWEVGKEPQSK